MARGRGVVYPVKLNSPVVYMQKTSARNFMRILSDLAHFHIAHCLGGYFSPKHSVVWSPSKIWLLFVIPCGRIQQVLEIWEDAGVSSTGIGVASDPLETPLPHVLATVPNWVVYVKRYESTCGCPPEKCCPSRPAFQGHPRSSEPTRIDRPLMTSC